MSLAKILCKLNIHKFKQFGEVTRGYDGRGGYIYKTRLVCSNCGESKLKVAKRE